jgi:uncharacterized protein
VKELVEYLVKSLAEHPDAVELTEDEFEGTISMELKISPDDLGRIIGKGGNTINAIRTVVQAAASSHKKRAKLEVVSE